MAFELAASLRFENIILIGQDLAYAQDKSSHSEDYMYKSLHKNDYERDENLYKCEAYGGLGVVQSSLVWTLFRQSLQKDASLVSSKLNIKVFNATQGGARIKACIEKPFKECCEELLSKDIKTDQKIAIDYHEVNLSKTGIYKVYYRFGDSFREIKVEVYA